MGSLGAGGICGRVQVTVAFSGGFADPSMLNVDTFGTLSETAPVKSDAELTEFVKEKFDLRKGALVVDLALMQQDYLAISSFGQFGGSDPSWEKPKELI